MKEHKGKIEKYKPIKGKVMQGDLVVDRSGGKQRLAISRVIGIKRGKSGLRATVKYEGPAKMGRPQIYNTYHVYLVKVEKMNKWDLMVDSAKRLFRKKDRA